MGCRKGLGQRGYGLRHRVPPSGFCQVGKGRSGQTDVPIFDHFIRSIEARENAGLAVNRPLKLDKKPVICIKFIVCGSRIGNSDPRLRPHSGRSCGRRSQATARRLILGVAPQGSRPFSPPSPTLPSPRSLRYTPSLTARRTSQIRRRPRNRPQETPECSPVVSPSPPPRWPP